ncbi:hypothetical protein Zmor_006999 [Zophobas morio]|uniref:EGF-like domain-containing protein n=1 Tax=Zophobas morio TaxID=2755281 RepID=A0AA38MN58_9CUCU|nr:hypothetical protein Zmor_006999 [Zophobas morio]
MFIFLFYLLLNMKLTFSTVVVQNSGLYTIRKDDIGMIFFLTAENTFDFKMPVSIYNVECVEGDPYLETSDYMYLLGGDMGYIDSKSVKNLTLIYPNLYLRNRIGKCLVSLHFQTDDNVEEVRKEIFFDSNKVYEDDEGDSSHACSSQDLSNSEGCCPIDCVVKYSSRRSYLNKDLKMCQPVPECPPNAVYLPRSNVCRKLHEPVCKSDLEMIEGGYVEKCHSVSNLVNFQCHHGSLDNITRECTCDEGWTTSACSEGAYHPTLNTFHMCNIELNTWERANREKLIMTILALVILAIAIAAKMLIAVCLLNWCCHFIRGRRKHESEDDFCESYSCPAFNNYCGDEVCYAANALGQNRSSRSIKVSFSNIDTVSSAGETDVTVSVDDKTESGSTTDLPDRASLHICHCNN